MRSLLLVMALTVAVPLIAAEPVIPNRAPKPEEWGYRPADGASVRFNPPSLIWVHEPEAKTYAVQWSPRDDFQDAVTVENLPFNTYTHNTTLKPGVHFWRYRFTTKTGAQSGWSIARKLTIPPDATEFPMPTRAQQRERVPKEHPRLFLRPEDLPRLKELANGKEAERFKKLRAEADKLLAGEPTPEPKERGTSRDDKMRQFWWPNRVQTLKVCQEAETLAFVFLITGEEKYGAAARKWVLHLASWDPDGPTNFSLNDEAAMPLVHRLPRAYDWAYGALKEDDRAKVRQAMLRRAQDVWKSGQVRGGSGHLNSPYNSHANRVWHKLGECAIAFLGEIPEADDWLDYALNKFYAAYPVWSDDDGGWHEGVSYWAGYMSKVVWWLQVQQSALGIDGLKKPFFSQVGDFALYLAPPNSPNEGFGDLSYNRPSKGWGGFLEYFQRANHARPGGERSAYWRWWSEKWGMSGEGGILGFLYAANLGPLPEPKPPSDLAQSKVFHGIGVASLHSTLLDSNEDVHFLFKSSPFGSQSHGHNAQNGFQLNAYGEALLTCCVYRDYHGSKFHYDWCHSTVAQNGVLVNGVGQVKHSVTVGGRIVDEKLTPQLDYVCGDATAAYGGKLTRYRRHVAFVKPDLIVLHDDLAAPEPAAFQFMLHALKEFTLDEKAARVSIEQPKAGVVAQYLSPVPLAFRQWDGYQPKPTKEFPNQWHVEASTQEKRRTLAVFTVIVPHKAGQRVEWTAKRVESDTALGVIVTRGGKDTLVAFRKEGVKGPATVEGLTFDGSAEMR